MKNYDLSLEQLMKIKGAIDSGVSAVTFPVTDKKGNINYFSARSITGYVSCFLTDLATNNGELLIADNKAVPGLRSISGTQLGANVNQLVYAVRILSDKTLVATTDAAIKAAEFESKAPANVKNGELKFYQGQVLLNTTGTDVTNMFAATSNDDTFKNVCPFNLRPQTEISIKLTQAGVPTANHAIKLEYRAIEVVPAEMA